MRKINQNQPQTNTDVRISRKCIKAVIVTSFHVLQKLSGEMKKYF